MKVTGKFRLHFNRHGAAPLVWCIATDDWELAVKSLDVKVPVISVYRAKAALDDEDGKPSAWLECEGELNVVDGNATVSSAKPDLSNVELFRAMDNLEARALESAVYDQDQWRWFRNRLEAFAYGPTRPTYDAFHDALHKLWTAHTAGPPYDKSKWLALDRAAEDLMRAARTR